MKHPRGKVSKENVEFDSAGVMISEMEQSKQILEIY